MDERTLIESHGLQGWSVDAADFPTGALLTDALEFCLNYAVLAPSGHNSQPWWFRVEAGAVVVGLDTSRGLAVADPDDREAIISVGAALLHLGVALRHFGFGTTTTLWPDARDPEACARVTVSLDRPAPEDEAPLFEAIARRHTSHVRFRDKALPRPVSDGLVQQAREEGVALHILGDAARRRAVAALVSQADRQQMADKRFRRELASWLRLAHTHRADGIVGYGADLGTLMTLAGPLVVRTFDLGDGRAARDAELAVGSPALALLSTVADDRSSWLAAGQALARVLLRATSDGLCIGFLNQPIEVPQLRAEVARLYGTDEYPQLLIRLGYGPVAPPQPRRSPEQCMST